MISSLGAGPASHKARDKQTKLARLAELASASEAAIET